MKVSIVIPCYNKECYVSEAIESALSQTYDDTEIIIVNDGSSDNSAQIIKKYADKYKKIIFFDKENNEGVIKARNFAIEAASGEYILPLDADDTIDPTYVEKAVKILEENKDIGVVYCKVKFFGEKNKEFVLEEYDANGIIYKNCICNCALFRKSDFINVGGYKEYMKDGCEDWDLLLSFIEKGLQPFKIEETLLNYRQMGMSRNKQCKNNLINIRRQLIKHHLDLYLENDKFIEKIFKKPNKEMSKKMKKLYIAVWGIMIFEIIQILLMSFYLFVSGRI